MVNSIINFHLKKTLPNFLFHILYSILYILYHIDYLRFFLLGKFFMISKFIFYFIKYFISLFNYQSHILYYYCKLFFKYMSREYFFSEEKFKLYFHFFPFILNFLIFRKKIIFSNFLMDLSCSEFFQNANEESNVIFYFEVKLVKIKLYFSKTLIWYSVDLILYFQMIFYEYY